MPLCVQEDTLNRSYDPLRGRHADRSRITGAAQRLLTAETNADARRDRFGSLATEVSCVSGVLISVMHRSTDRDQRVAMSRLVVMGHKETTDARPLVFLKVSCADGYRDVGT